MWGMIERLRQRSRAARNQAAFVGALSVALVVVGVWSLSIPSRVTTIVEGVDVEAVAERPSVWAGVLETPRELLSLLQKRTLEHVAAPAAAEPTVAVPVNPWVPTISSTSSLSQEPKGTPVLIATSSSATSS